MLGLGLIAYGSDEVKRAETVTLPAQSSSVALISPDPAAAPPAPTASAYLLDYVREYGRLPPVHHGQTTVIPGNPFKEGGLSEDGN
jgi:hypothetical protein